MWKLIYTCWKRTISQLNDDRELRYREGQEGPRVQSLEALNANGVEHFGILIPESESVSWQSWNDTALNYPGDSSSLWEGQGPEQHAVDQKVPRIWGLANPSSVWLAMLPGSSCCGVICFSHLYFPSSVWEVQLEDNGVTLLLFFKWNEEMHN